MGRQIVLCKSSLLKSGSRFRMLNVSDAYFTSVWCHSEPGLDICLISLSARHARQNQIHWHKRKHIFLLWPVSMSKNSMYFLCFHAIASNGRSRSERKRIAPSWKWLPMAGLIDFHNVNRIAFRYPFGGITYFAAPSSSVVRCVLIFINSNYQYTKLREQRVQSKHVDDLTQCAIVTSRVLCFEQHQRVYSMKISFVPFTTVLNSCF